MTLSRALAYQRSDTIDRTAKYLPTPALEYWFYAQVFYNIMGDVLGISISLVGVSMLAAMAGVCVLRMGKYSIAIMRSIAAPLACGVSFIAVQTLVHGESVGNLYVREFVPWMVGLVIVQYLALRRGFLHRCTMVLFVIGLSTLPYMRLLGTVVGRIGLEGTITIANPNDLGAWFGFCCVYFIVLGLETRRNWMRVISWLTAVGCLLVVGLTVSRAPLFAAALSIVIAFRRALNRGFFPLLSLIVLAWLAYGLGLFDRPAAMYAQRGLEETGRLLVWPLAIRRFLQAPLVGVGIDDINTFLPTGGIPVAPHNGFIFIALASGLVPLLFFSIYWLRLLIDGFRANASSHEDAPFITSLLVYSFLIVMNLNLAFMGPWTMATLATVTGTGFLLNAGRVVGAMDGRQAARRRGLPALAGRSRA